MDKGDKAIHARALLENPMLIQIIIDMEADIQNTFDTIDPNDIEDLQVNVIKKQILNQFRQVIEHYIFDATKEKPKFF